MKSVVAAELVRVASRRWIVVTLCGAAALAAVGTYLNDDSMLGIGTNRLVAGVDARVGLGHARGIGCRRPPRQFLAARGVDGVHEADLPREDHTAGNGEILLDTDELDEWLQAETELLAKAELLPKSRALA